MTIGVSGTDGNPMTDGPATTWRTVLLAAMGVLGVLVLGALMLTLSEANAQRDEALAAQRHSYDVMVLSRALQGTIAQSEASLGRYVISGDQKLGQTYYDDWRRAAGNLDQLERLVHDNAGQIARMKQLRRVFEGRGNQLALIALSTNYHQNSQALARYYDANRSDPGINALLDAIIADERGLLEARTSKAMATVRTSTTTATVLVAFGLVIVTGAIVLGWFMVRAQTDRALARAEVDSERRRADELATAVTAATTQLRAQEARLHQIQKMDAVGQLTGGIAHDFNNMLAVIMGGIELARRQLGNDPAQVARHLDSANDGAVRAAALTNRLLAFSREAAINPEPIEVGALFADMADLLDRTLGDGITLTTRDDSHGWRTRADRVQLENTIVNLAVNARDAMDGRGTLTIAAATAIASADDAAGRAAGEYLTVTVTDTGCGMSQEVLARAFDPFFTTKPVGKGTGLGLSQIYGFTHQVGGVVSIDTAPGRGTSVTLHLPRDVEAAAAAATPARKPEPGATPVARDALSVLVVEDDSRVLAATMGALKELGHAPVACDDPMAAAATLAAMPAVDLIVSDVLMPGLTGPEMVAALPPAHAAVPVLFVTGYAGEANGAIDLGGRPVLRKPFTLAGLAQAVTAAAAAGADAATAPAPTPASRAVAAE